MAKKGLIVADLREKDIAFACAVMTRYLSQREESAIDIEYYLTQAGTVKEELSQVCSQKGAYSSIVFLGALFPGISNKKGIGDEIESMIGKGGASFILYLNGSTENPLQYEINPKENEKSSESSVGNEKSGEFMQTFSGDLDDIGTGAYRKDATINKGIDRGLLPGVLAYCKKREPSFDVADIIGKQTDDYTQYCFQNALDEYRLHHDSEYFVTLVQQLSVCPEGAGGVTFSTCFNCACYRCNSAYGSAQELSGDSEEEMLLKGDELRQVLRQSPDAIVHFSIGQLKTLSGKDWVSILNDHPGYWERCKEVGGWKQLSGDDWGDLLYRHYKQFQEQCDWQKLKKVDARSFVRLVERHPEIAKKCEYDWTKLEARDWADLLENQPQFSEYCKLWGDFSGEDWMTLLSDQPQFAVQCKGNGGWKKLDKVAWLELLPMQPRFAKECPDKIWQEFGSSDWLLLLKCRKPFENECKRYGGWEKLDGDSWVELLRSDPEQSANCTDYSGWRKFNGGDWSVLLQYLPRFEEECTQCRGWLMLSEENWVELLKVQPDFQKHHTVTLDGEITLDGWLTLLGNNPDLADKCNCLEAFTSEQWVELLRQQPALSKNCPSDVIKKLKPAAVISLLDRIPELSVNWSLWNRLTPEDWCRLLSKQSQYAMQCMESHGWERFKTEDWVSLLSIQPQFASYFQDYSTWESLTADQWITLVKKQPQFQRCREFGSVMRDFSVSQWCHLLSSQPQMSSDAVPWHKFTAENWLELLCNTSSFNDQFRAGSYQDLFKVEHWQKLLCVQPEFISACPVRNEIPLDVWKRAALASFSDEGLEMIPPEALHSLDQNELAYFMRLHPRYVNLLTSEQLQAADEFALSKSFVANGGKLPGGVKVDWQRFKGGGWCYLLAHYPEYQVQCTQVKGWQTLDGFNWSLLLIERPELSGYCDRVEGWKTLDGYNWMSLLIEQPQFADKCNWQLLSSSHLTRLYLQQPQLREKVKKKKHFELSEELILSEINGDSFEAPTWVAKGEIPWNSLTSTDLARVLVINPNLELDYEQRGIFKILNSVEWYIILRNCPEFSKYCPFAYLSPKMRLAILSQEGVVTGTADDYPWPLKGEIDYKEEIDLIFENDQIVRTFTNGKISSRLINWGKLLSMHVEYAPCCPSFQWDELTIRGWKEIESKYLSLGKQGYLDSKQEEKLWKYYSYFLRLPQRRLEKFEKDSRETFENIYWNAITKYHSMLVGEGLRPLREQLRMAAKNRYPVLILGESGTGKENAAQMLHSCSERKGKLEAFNCASSTSGLVESALFGHTKGAFTGADKAVDGIIYKANGGTLFFDEIAEFPLETQAKLLRVMQWRTSNARDASGHLKNLKKMVYAYRPVGGEDDPEIEVDVRIVAATNRDLEQMVAEKDPNNPRFREDLYYRLNSIVIRTIPLREHKEDIEEIANLFWRVDLQMPNPLKSEEIAYLKSLDYPANIRQLQQLLIQYSIYEGRRTLPAIFGNLSNMSQRIETEPEEQNTEEETENLAEESSDNPPSLDPEQYIAIKDSKTGAFKTADAIDKEYAKLVHRLIGKSLVDTAQALDMSINTLRNRLK